MTKTVKNSKTKKLTIIGFIIISICLMAAMSLASNHAQVQVTLETTAINELSISGGNVTLTIDTATAGYEPNAALDYLSPCLLNWTTNETNKKITVSTGLANRKFALYLTSQNIPGGNYYGPTQLGTTAKDYIYGISNTTGSCDLQYLAMATVTQGTGTDTHTSITFTLTDG